VDCISSYEAMQAANPRRGVRPGGGHGLHGYWPLDTTNGARRLICPAPATTRRDAAGLSANGRVNGCLVFNGTSSYVQITNPVCNDFTIAFGEYHGDGRHRPMYKGVGWWMATIRAGQRFWHGDVRGKFAFASEPGHDDLLHDFDQ